MLENFGRKSKSPEPSTKSRKLSVDEVSPPVPQRRKKKKTTISEDLNGSEVDIYHSMSFSDVSAQTWQQPIEQKDHWGLSPGLKAKSSRMSSGDLPKNSQTSSLNYKITGKFIYLGILVTVLFIRGYLKIHFQTIQPNRYRY